MEQWWEFMHDTQEVPITRTLPRKNDKGEQETYTTMERRCQYREYGTWYNFNHFRFKVFKKGTIHMEFLDEKVWILFNQTAAKAKGFQLASKFKGDFRAKKEGVEVY